MVKTTSKGLAIASIAGAVALIAAACGGGGEATPTSTPRPTATAAATATAALRPTPTPAPTPTPVPPQPKQGGVLNVWMTRDPSTLDLHRVRSSSDWITMLPQMNWLVQNPQAKEGLGPDLAQSWTVSQDGTVYTFNLVRNARWHDGKPVTADDVLWTIDRITRNADGKVPAPPYLGSLSLVTRTEKLDEFTVKMTLSRTSASFLPTLGAIGNVIYPKHVPITEFEQKRPVGSGPFVFKEWKGGDSVTFTKNPDYFKRDASGRQLPYLDGIKSFVIQDEAAGLAAFRLGKLDITFPHSSTVLRGKVGIVKREVPGVQLFTSGAGFFYITFRAGVQPWDNVQIRRAISLAVDRVAANAALTEGEGDPFMFLEPTGSRFALSTDALKKLPGYSSGAKAADIQEAKRLLTQAGVVLEGMKLTIPVRDIYKDTGAVVIDQLNRNLGMQADLRVMDNATTQQVQARGDFQVYVSSNSAGIVDPAFTIDPFVRSGSGLNYSKWNDPEIDRLLDSLDAELDTPKRIKIAQDLQLKLIDRAWYITLGSSPTTWAWTGALKNFAALINQDGPPWRYEDVWLDR